MTLEEARDQLAKALRKAVEHHGQPNSFSPAELHVEYGGPPPMLAGRIGRHFMGSLFRALGGRDSWGSPPVYAKGGNDGVSAPGWRFYV